jgi:hypothetical protein
LTLIVTVTGPETIWLLADRRLSAKGRPPKDDGRKIMLLETTDGVAILGYAGLGATARGTEPADWMSAVLRGRNLPLEQSLGTVADALKSQFPRHMVGMPKGITPSHTIVVPAFLGTEPRLYTIDLALTPDRKSYTFRYTRHVIDKTLATTQRPPLVRVAGSGGAYLAQRNNKKWLRDLIRVAKACDRRQLSALAVADHLAKLNNEVHDGVRDKSVGPRCIVAWRHRKGGIHNIGGADQFYTGTTRDSVSLGLPTIGVGMDVAAISDATMRAMMPHMEKILEAMRAGRPPPELKTEELNAAVAPLPTKPDENFR